MTLPRFRVTKRLQGLQAALGQTPIVVFQAPAGCGKTQAAEWWGRQLAKPIVWLQLAHEQSLWTRTALLQALVQQIHDISGEPLLGSVLTVDTCLTMLQRAFPAGVTIVLDDWHLAHGEDMQNLVTKLGHADWPALTLLVTTRIRADLPDLPAWQVRGRALVVDAEDLRFDYDDVAAFLGTSPALTEHSLTLTDGKPFALIVVVGMLHRGLPPAQWTLGANLARYFQQEVLAGYPASLVEFVKATIIMDSFTADDCKALGLTDVDVSLQQMLGDHLFLRRSGDRFSYHDLARQALLAGMGPIEQQERCLQTARLLFQRRDPGCLSLFVAAAAYPEAARAMLWFQFTLWREPPFDQQTLSFWMAKLPATLFETDPAGMSLYTRLHIQIPPDIRIAILNDACKAFRQGGEATFVAITLVMLGILYYEQNQLAAWEQIARQLEDCYGSASLDSAMRTPLLNALVRYHGLGSRDPDRLVWWLQALRRQVPATPGSLAVHFNTYYVACTAFIHFGDAEAAWQVWHQALELLPRLPGYECYLLGMEVEIQLLGDPPPSGATVPTYRPPQVVLPSLEAVRLFDLAERAWFAGDPVRAESQYRQVLALQESSGPLMEKLYQSARIRLSQLQRQRGDAEAALAVCRPDRSWDGDVHTRSLSACQEAAALAALGRTDEALALVRRVAADAERCQFTFLWVVASLQQACWQRIAPAPEVGLLIEAWRYRPALLHLWPDLLCAETALPARVAIRSLGDATVTVEGRSVAWRRHNAQIILLDLLLHPEGSTGQDLQRRYWPLSDPSSIRKDVQALRTLFEPDRAGSDSRYVTLEQGRYRLTRDPALIWWDIDALRALHRFGRRAVARMTRAPKTWEPYLRPLAPTYAAYEPFIRLRDELAALQADLRLTAIPAPV